MWRALSEGTIQFYSHPIDQSDRSNSHKRELTDAHVLLINFCRETFVYLQCDPTLTGEPRISTTGDSNQFLVYVSMINN